MEHIKENLAAAKSEWEKGNHKAAKHYYDLVLKSDPENPEAELYAEYDDLFVISDLKKRLSRIEKPIFDFTLHVRTGKSDPVFHPSGCAVGAVIVPFIGE